MGLGWPHRGEPVTVTAWYYQADGEKASVAGAPGIYLNAYDILDVTPEVWLPALSTRHREATLIVEWSPRLGGPRRNADPAGRITMRVADARTRPLPVPLPRWPVAADVGGDTDPQLITPPGGQLKLFT